MIYENEYNANEIIPNLWIGNYISSQDESFIQKYNIKIIINSTLEFPNKFENKNIFYKIIPIKDTLSGAKYIEKNLQEIINLINYGIKNNIGILVHCKAGHTRSANIVALYLYHEFFDNYHDSINFVRNLREHTLKSESRILKYFSKKYS